MLGESLWILVALFSSFDFTNFIAFLRIKDIHILLMYRIWRHIVSELFSLNLLNLICDDKASRTLSCFFFTVTLTKIEYNLISKKQFYRGYSELLRRILYVLCTKKVFLGMFFINMNESNMLLCSQIHSFITSLL